MSKKLKLLIEKHGASFLFFALWLIFASQLLHALDPQQWWKKVGQQRTRKVTQKQTTVAAVRGVDEPSDIDPKARDFDGVALMEKRTVSSTRLARFISEGKLKKAQTPEQGVKP